MILFSILFGKRMIKYVFVPLLLLGAVIYTCNSMIEKAGLKKCFADLDSIPSTDVGLVLGANKSAKGGKNLFFQYRIEAAIKLFKTGKIKHIIVSGDNHIKEYNEAEDMQKALMEMGVPDSCITLDYAGFRTLDSVVRCEKIFGQKKFTIISQEFHNERALFIADANDLDCVAFNAQDVPHSYSLKTRLREYFARVKCVLDIYLLHTQPKFLGEKIVVNV